MIVHITGYSRIYKMARIKQQQGIVPAGCPALISAVPVVRTANPSERARWGLMLAAAAQPPREGLYG